MARIKCPTNVSSITLSTSGVLSPDAAGIITCTSLEANALAMNGAGAYNQKGVATLVSTDASGNLLIAVPAVVTGITISGTAYTVTGATMPFGKCLNTTVPPAVGSQFLYQNFSLVNG